MARRAALSQLRREERARLVEVLARYPLPWTGDEGYRKAEVTGGGVALGGGGPAHAGEPRPARGSSCAASCSTPSARSAGYNFAWAWATGRAAGLGAAAAGPEPRPGCRETRRTTLLAGFPVVVEVPVAWADMDYFRHVNNIVFFR